jgi:hypothetical protein
VTSTDEGWREGGGTRGGMVLLGVMDCRGCGWHGFDGAFDFDGNDDYCGEWGIRGRWVSITEDGLA